MNRRHFLGYSSASLLACALGSHALLASAPAHAANPSSWRMPDEGEPHAATWLAFAAIQAIWGRKLLAGARDSQARIAQAIAGYETVNMLVREQDYDLAYRLCGAAANLVVAPLDDLWLRDTGPVFVEDALGQRAAIDFNFNGWGNKQTHANDAKVAARVAAHSRTPLLHTKLVLEGGGIEVDGEGTAIITESCVLNRNRNPGVSKAACETELKRLLGLQKIIWLPGIAGRDITDGHTDFYARFAGPGVVVVHSDTDPASFDYAVTRRHLDILKTATDARGRKLQLIVIPGARSTRPRYRTADFAAGYVNFYVCNHAVIAPQFGDTRADRYCRDALRDAFPDRDVVQLDIDAIAAGGGGIHCITQQQPA
ncbi:MAG: agmatine deiminase family protein [Vogesella sp.]|uniref:agmatine deiminase family protein n=1 Tax=Vogesella sp. TaxID=1904252 RepID=UPI003F376DE9